jgi:hypothetical protein
MIGDSVSNDRGAAARSVGGAAAAFIVVGNRPSRKEHARGCS